MTIETVYSTLENIYGADESFASVLAVGGVTYIPPISVVVFEGTTDEARYARIEISVAAARAWGLQLLAAANAVDHYDYTTPCQTCGVRCVTTDTICELDAENNECAKCAQDRIESEIERVEALRVEALRDARREREGFPYNEDERRDHAVRIADFKAEMRGRT